MKQIIIAVVVYLFASFVASVYAGAMAVPHPVRYSHSAHGRINPRHHGIMVRLKDMSEGPVP